MSRLKDLKHVVQIKDFFYSYDKTQENSNTQVKVFQNTVMECSTSGSLEDYMQQNLKSQTRLSMREVQLIAKQILMGLKELHSQGIAHRDLKPENILYFEDEESWKISDFGQSKLLAESETNTPYCVATYYRAPELILGSKCYNSKIDIWAFGCIFYEMLTLQPLFNGKNDALQLLEQIKTLGDPDEATFQEMSTLLQKTGLEKWRELCKSAPGCFHFEEFFEK